MITIEYLCVVDRIMSLRIGLHLILIVILLLFFFAGAFKDAVRSVPMVMSLSLRSVERGIDGPPMLAVGLLRLMVLIDIDLVNISILTLVVICSHFFIFLFNLCSHSFSISIFLNFIRMMMMMLILLVVREIAILTVIEDGLLLFRFAVDVLVMLNMVLCTFQELFVGRGAIGTITTRFGPRLSLFAGLNSIYQAYEQLSEGDFGHLLRHVDHHMGALKILVHWHRDNLLFGFLGLSDGPHNMLGVLGSRWHLLAGMLLCVERSAVMYERGCGRLMLIGLMLVAVFVIVLPTRRRLTDMMLEVLVDVGDIMLPT